MVFTLSGRAADLATLPRHCHGDALERRRMVVEEEVGPGRGPGLVEARDGQVMERVAGGDWIVSRLKRHPVGFGLVPP